MCIVNLTPSGVVGTPNGRWFLTGAAGGGWAGSLDVSCDGVTFVTINSLPSATIPLNNACGDTSNIYVDLTSFTDGASFTFKFVSPDTADANQCNDDCIDCQNYGISVELTPADVVAQICTDDPADNLYDIAGIDCNDWFLLSYQAVPPSPQDVDFIFAGGCGTKGSFNPANITPDTYVFEFRRATNIDECEECLVVLTLTVTDPPEVGVSFADNVCV